MADKKYKAIFVERDTHHEFMVEARKTDFTANEFLKFLLEFLKQKNGKTNNEGKRKEIFTHPSRKSYVDGRIF